MMTLLSKITMGCIVIIVVVAFMCFAYITDTELKYWRSSHPEEHQCAKQNGFKIGTEACLECW